MQQCSANGTITILMISIIISTNFTSINVPASIFINNGVRNGATNVAIAVTMTDNTRLALARYTMTFDASPLLQLPIKMIPAAISGFEMKDLCKQQSHQWHDAEMTKQTDQHTFTC